MSNLTIVRKHAGKEEGIGSIWRLSQKNAWFWRWRLFTVAAVISLSFTLFTLYGAFMDGVASSGLARTEGLSTKYYDVLVIPPPNKTIKDRDELPMPKYQRKIFGVGEAAVGLFADSRTGSISLLGIQSDSAFFDFVTEELQGCRLKQQGEALLPSSYAKRSNLHPGDLFSCSRLEQNVRRNLTLEVVGIYHDDSALAPALISIDDAYSLQALPVANRYLINYDRNSKDGNLPNLVEWMASTYPGALLICDDLPHIISQSLLSRILLPSAGLLVLFFIFMCVGILTVALMTFLERRKELAALKSCGITNKQVGILLSMEYVYSAMAGFGLGLIMVGAISYRLMQLDIASIDSVISYGLQAGVITILVLCLAVLFPTLTARAATVSQLLFARVIPLKTTHINSLPNQESWLVLRERQDNVRILRFPIAEQVSGFLVFKQVGDMVKQGEVVVTYEGVWGMHLIEWSALCDGRVSEITPGGILVIEPDDPHTPYYPYPEMIIQREQERIDRIEQGRQAAREERSRDM